MINQKRALDFFKNICRIPSKTKNEKEINAFLKNILTEMGFECWEDKAAQETGGNANNLYGRLKGDPAYKSVCFMAHTDSVQNLDNLVIIEEGNIIRSDGNTILGADDKAGIAIIIESVRSIIENGEPHGDIYVLFCVQEESGTGSAFVSTENFTPDITFNFDETVPPISLEIKGPTEYRMEFKISMETVRGPINPITVASKAITRTASLTDDEEVFCNIGYINGGYSKYRDPKECSVHILIKSHNHKKVTNMSQEIERIFREECKNSSAEISCENQLVYIAFDIPQDDEAMTLVRMACDSMNEKPVIRENFDCFDTSALNAKGLKTITVSTGYEKYHTTEEFLNIDQFLKNTEFAYQILKNIHRLEQK